MFDLTRQQMEICTASLQEKLFLKGPAGSGKTTSGVERMLQLSRQDIPANSILVLTPQRTLAYPYYSALQQDPLPNGGSVNLLTVGGLARRSVDLFWPLAAEQAGFTQFEKPPIFLTLETSQYHMARLVRPLLDEGYFGSIVIDRNRLYSQIIDNLNKAASVGFPVGELGARLGEAWDGDPAQKRVYSDVQDCANRFRAYCLENNLLDYSLQLEVFWNYLWPNPIVRNHLSRAYQHLIYDNLEEDTPRAHDIILEWAAEFSSCLFIHDGGGGFRQFLGADPHSALRLAEVCNRQMIMEDSFVMSPEIRSLVQAFDRIWINPTQPARLEHPGNNQVPALPVRFPIDCRYFPQMLDWVVNEISDLVLNQDVPPSEIVVLAPFLSDSLRFSIENRLASMKIPTRSHRPSRSLRNEPASQALLTLAALAHPGWSIRPSVFDVTYTLLFCIENMDLVRAQLLVNKIYHQKELELSPFDKVETELQDRITFTFGNRYTQLKDWLENYRLENPQPFDHFLRRLFGEVLSQPGFGFHRNLDAARVAASLIESVRKFRLVIDPTHPLIPTKGMDVGREYIQLLLDGILAAQYLEAWNPGTQEAVLISPAYTFLMMNHPVNIQFWLDPASNGWTERINQPLTQPYVLSRDWLEHQVWTDADEISINHKSLFRLVSGLLHRCRSGLYLGISNISENGYEQRGSLLKSFQRIFQHAK
jgi:hypothetical protein